MSLTTQSIAAPKCMSELQQQNLSKFIKKCEATELDLAFYKEQLLLEQTMRPEPPMNQLLVLGMGILAGVAITAAVVGAKGR